MADGETPVVFLHDVERRYQQGDATLDDPRRAPSSRSGPASRWRWSRRRAPASRRCCTSPACSSIPTRGEVYIDGVATSTLSRRRAHPHPAHRDRLRLPVPPPAAGVLGARERDAAADDPRPVAQARRAQRAAELLAYLGLKERLDPPAGRTVRRRAAARRDRARGRQRAAHPARRRADRQPRPAHRRARVRRADAAGAASGLAGDRHPQHGARRPHGPAGDAREGQVVELD